MLKRSFVRKPFTRGYKPLDAFKVNKDMCTRISESGTKNIVTKLTVPARAGLAWEVKKGQTCRFVLTGSQVGDVNIWNLHNFGERFYSGKTRQIHRSHLSTGDRLWSNMPYLRPLATVTADSLEDYGIDEDGFSVHDVLGTRCDPYMHKHMTGTTCTNSCHQNLTEAIKPWGLTEEDVHDVFNIFMCTAIDPKTHEYMIKGSPAEKGDYIEILAEMDLLVALSACPCADVSAVCGEPVPPEKCSPIDVSIGQPSKTLLHEILTKWN